MAEHTPGPWRVDDTRGCKSIFAGDDRIFSVTDLGFTDGLADEAEDEANARLIAAAPDLLVACEVALSDFENIVNATMVPAMKVHPFTLTPNQLRAAIAKARGQETDK